MKTAEYRRLFCFSYQLPSVETRTSKLRSSSSWKQMRSSWSLLRASPLEPRHSSLKIHPMSSSIKIDSNLLILFTVLFSFQYLCFRSWLDKLFSGFVWWKNGGNGVAGEVVNRPALPGNRPLSEADPTMHDLVIQESPKSKNGRCDEMLCNIITSSTAQGGGGSFKNRKPIGEIGCCESRMSKQRH